MPENNLLNNLIPSGTLFGQLAVGGAIPEYVGEWLTISNANGQTIMFNTDTIRKLYECFNVIQFTQSGSGNPSPTNIRPITGYDRFSVTISNGEDTNSYEMLFGDAGNVFKGTLNAITGVLTVTHGYLDLGSINWQTLSVYQGKKAFMSQIFNDIKANTASSQIPDIVCSNYPTLNGDGVYLARLGVSLWSTQQRFAIYDPDCETMTGAEFKTHMNGVQLVYELNASKVYNLGGMAIYPVIGNNTFSCNTGICDITYLETINNKLENVI